MEELFRCEYWADTSALIKQGAVFPVGSKRPDFVCGFADGTLGVFEAKGTTGTAGNLALTTGKAQTQGIDAADPIKWRVVVGAALGGDNTKVILLDPEPKNGLIKTNIDIKLVAKAAKRMRVETETMETIFRGPRGEIALKREEYREDKRHGWLGLLDKP